MVNPVQPIAPNQPPESATAESRRHADSTQVPTQAPVPSEVVTLSELALQGTQPATLRERRRAAASVPRSPGEADAAAHRLRGLLIAIGPQAARAQAYASPERVWNFLRE